MRCIHCGGRVESQQVTFVYDDDNDYFFVENVPAEVCVQCGEKSYSPEVTDELLSIAKKERASAKTIQVPVFDYVNRMAP